MEKKTASVRVPADLHRQAKARAALEGRSVQDVYTQLLNDWLAKQAKEQQAPDMKNK